MKNDDFDAKREQYFSHYKVIYPTHAVSAITLWSDVYKAFARVLKDDGYPDHLVETFACNEGNRAVMSRFEKYYVRKDECPY